MRPVLTFHETIAHPHLRERGTVRRVSDHEIGEFDIPADKIFALGFTSGLQAGSLGGTQ
jgi:crotonobetainyl-CoA:carnitine CoA-transferase CaiB-like acyl-CoA transferase